MGRAARAGAALLVVAVGGCTNAPAPGPPPPPAPVAEAWPGCAKVGAFPAERRGPDPSRTGGVPPGFTARSVVLCEQTSRTTPGGDEVGVDLERTSGETGPLLAYLALPDDRTPRQACTADAWLPPWLVLVDADGRYVLPRIPVDECAKPLGWRDDLPWTSLPYTDRVVRASPVR